MATINPYQALGVAKTASQEEIRSAYRSLAKKYHPDLNPGSKEAERRFKELSTAYDQIGTPEARAKFDRGESGFEQRPPRQGPFYRDAHEEDLFESIFGGGSRRRAGMKFPGEDTLYRMQVELREATLGAEKEILLPNGRKLFVRIPRGVTDGTRLRFAGQGGPGIHGGPPGDAYVELTVRSDPRFTRQGDDLILELPVSLGEALWGARVRVPTLEGEVLLKIPPHSNSGTRLRLPGKGAYSRAAHRRGDELVMLKVMLPESIDPELEEALRIWERRHPYDPRKRKAA